MFPNISFYFLICLFIFFSCISNFFLFCFFPWRYNQVDKHLKNWALQHITNREFKSNRLLCYNETFKEEKGAFDKTKVFFVFFSSCKSFMKVWLICCCLEEVVLLTMFFHMWELVVNFVVFRFIFSFYHCFFNCF